MPKKSAEEIQSLYLSMAGLYGQRNAEYNVLRNVFDAQFVGTAQQTAAGLGEFNDKKTLVYNMINTAIRRFMDELSAPTRLQAIPRGIKKPAIELAELRSKALKRVHEGENMTVKIIEAAYYQGLLDKAIWHVRPNPDKEYFVDIDLVLPEAYFPIPATDRWGETEGVLISWKKFNEDMILNHDVDPLGKSHEDISISSGRVIEYWSKDWYQRWDDGELVFEIKHDLGTILFEEAHNIPIPHRHRGQGDADQSVGLNEYLNELMSAQADVLTYLAAPIVVVRGSKAGSQNLVWGPKAIWDLERDGSAEILTWAGAPPSFEAQILRTMQGIEDNTGLSAPAFGREVPSGVSGETVRSILAGFNTRVGTKQTLMGHSLANVYKKVQLVWDKMFPSKGIDVPGIEDEDGNPARLEFKDLKGFYDLTIIFEPQNENVRVFTEMQKMEKRVQSRLRTMRNLGIPNPEDEEKRIIIEQMREIKFAQMLSAAQGGGGVQMDQFGQPQFGAPGALPPGRDPRQANQPTNIAGTPQLGLDLEGSDPGEFADLLTGGSGNDGIPGGEITVRMIMELIGDEDTEKSAFLSGRIVEDGVVEQKFDLVVQTASDAQRLRQALGPLASRANIKQKDVVQKTENMLSVTRPKTPRTPRPERRDRP